MTYPVQPSDPQEIRRIAARLLDRQTKNVVSDAIVLARWVLEQIPETPRRRDDEKA